MADTPQVQAAEEALEKGCSLSLELSQLLSFSGGPLQLQLSSGGGLPDLGHPAAARKGNRFPEKDRIVSYIASAFPPSPAGRPRSPNAKGFAPSIALSKDQPQDGKSRPVTPTTTRGTELLLEEAKPRTTSVESWEEGPQIVPELNFDPHLVVEYVSSPTKLEKGAIWMDGTSRPCTDMAWGPLAFRVLKAPPVVEKDDEATEQDQEPQAPRGRKAPASPVDSVIDPEIQIRVVDVGSRRSSEASIDGRRRRPSSARARASSGRPLHRPLSARRSQVGRASLAGASLIESSVGSAGPAAPVIEVPMHRWTSASHSSKRQLVYTAREGLLGPGEVSRLIHDVQFSRGGRGSRTMLGGPVRRPPLPGQRRGSTPR
eukprot:gb/GFBE01031751.1/.p1 GENE.gb/GFBE01031751.1/~~gb/GFBE01031751.1/.p1  ORF type:complete len:373 (+),score=30.38 gb/GFBE01031751.1/:1-1119(+)